MQLTVTLEVIKPFSSRLYFHFNDEICNNLLKGSRGKQFSVVLNILSNAKSRGEILLSSTNIKDQPKIRIGLYSNGNDLEVHAKCVMHYNRILNTTYFKSVGAELIDPKIKMCDGLDKNSKTYWKCYCMGMVSPAHFYVGTCAMGSVVDSELNVLGIKNLRIADASGIPINVASPPMGTIIMIAQRASDLIIKSHF